jgi:signal transduction histidine kinase
VRVINLLPKLSNLIKTFTFRLALVYVGLFGFSVIVLFAFIYAFAMNYVEGQIRDSIRTQYAYLLDEYQSTGSSGAVARIKEMISSDDDGTGIYLFVNQKNEKLAGNLVAWPESLVEEDAFEKDGHWAHFRIIDAHGGEGIEIRAIVKPLSKWRTVLIGQSVQAKARIERTIVQTFWASLFLTIAMAFFGAMVMTQSVMRRINVINRSAATIMGGHLSVRIPYAPGGDEFDELSVNLNRMLDRIETLLQSLSEFASNIAHDLRSPLTRIINRMDAGLRGIERDNPSYKLLEKNIADLQGLVATFNSILKISELEANTEFQNFETCDVRQIIENLVELYEPYATEKNIRLTSAISEPILLTGEKNLLTQAFANLIDNAIKFTAAGGHVAIISEDRGHVVDIIVADDGPGIPQEFRDKVFEKFFRLEQSRNTKGNGLGLSLVAAVARIHRANVTLEDNNPGLQVILSFPLSNA